MAHPVFDPKRPADAGNLSDEALEEVNRLWTIVRALSATVHDVNNALQVISGSAELLAGRATDPLVQRRVEAIRGQAGRAASLLEQLLSYSRGDGATKEVIDAAPLLQTAVALRASTLGRAQIGLGVDGSDGSPYWVSMRRARALQLFLNLLLLAEESVRDRSNPTIAVRLERHAGNIAVSVTARWDELADNGSWTSVARPSAGVTTGAPLWAASRLAASEGAVLTVSSGADGELSLGLVLPSHASPA